MSTGGPGPVAGPASADLDADLDEVARLRRRVAELEASSRSARAWGRVRSVVTWMSVVLTCAGVVLASVAWWTSATLLETDRFMQVVEPALTSPELDAALSTRVTAETLAALALQERVAGVLSDVEVALGDALAEALDVTPAQRARVQRLPLPQLQELAAPIASGLESRISGRIDEVVRSGRLEELVVDVTRGGHTKAVALLREEYEQLPNLVVASGEVRADLVPVVAAVLADLVDQGLDVVGIDEIPFVDVGGDPEASLARLSQALGVELPPDFGQVTVMSEQDLEELQAGVRLMDQLVWAAVATVLVLAMLTLVTARDRRRAVVQLGVGTALGTAVAIPLIRSTVDTLAGAAATPQGRDLVVVLANSALGSLRSVLVVVLVVALLVAVLAHLAGRPPWMRRSIAAVRTATEPTSEGSALAQFAARRHDSLVVGVIGVAVLALWAVGMSLLSIVVIVGVAAALVIGIDTARRQVPEEVRGDLSTDAAPESPTGTASPIVASPPSPSGSNPP